MTGQAGRVSDWQGVAGHGMAGTTTASLSDSLRELAHQLDGLPALQGARLFPDVPVHVGVSVRTGLAVAALARDCEADVHTHLIEEDGKLHTYFEVERGAAVLHIDSIEPLTRELRRRAGVDEELMGRDL